MKQAKLLTSKSFRLYTFLFILILNFSMLSALTLINENIQNWTAYTSYGSYTQTIPAGTVSMTRVLVSPNAAASGTGSIGRIQCEASTGIVQFPELVSVGQVEFHFAAGSTGRSVKLQKLNDSTWEDITIFSGITATGATFSYAVNIGTPTTLRLANPSHALYIHDIIINDYQAVELPIVTTGAVSNITYNSAVSGGNIENSGASQLTARGVCWSRNINPQAMDSLTTDGTGIGTFISTITGLLSDTDYHVRAYATNSSGTSYGEDILFRTANIGVPSLQASNLILYPGSTSVQATWTPGNGAKRIVKINTANNFTLPTNGINYIANPIYTGSGEQVVYNGATQIIEGEAINAVSVTGLTPNTTYWFRVFDYNGSGTEILYTTITAANNPRSTTTLNSILTGYYNGITGTGATLKTNLHNLLRTTHLTAFSYDALWTQLQYTDEDSTNTNNILQIYTGWSIPKSYSGGGTSQWNREHTWSKSHGDFGETAPAGTDLHHLRPCDSTVNSSKGNKDFDEGGTPVTDNSPYSGYTGTTGCYTDTDSWEPRDVEKGDVARMILYMAVRYDGTDTSYNLEMADLTPTAGAFYGKLSTLLQWHLQDPPDGWERRRNNRIHERQGNRNPFVDHPEFVNQIWAPVTTYPTITDSVTFIANWTAAVNAQSYTMDVAYDNSFTNFVTGFNNLNVGNTTSRTVTVPASNTTYYYRLKAFFTAGYSMYSNVSAASLFNQPYELTSFTAVATTQAEASVNWVTAFENGMSGFYIYRSLDNNLSNALNITPTILPATNTLVSHSYNYLDTDVEAGNGYYYWLMCWTVSTTYDFHGPIFVQITSNDDEVQAGQSVSINNIYPNPFSRNASIEINLAKTDKIKLSVYNLKGQCVRKIYEGTKASGTSNFSWDGLDDNNRPVQSGIYFCKLQTAKDTQTLKLVLMK